MRWIRALGATVALLAMIVGVPALLVGFVGNPWPTGGIDPMAPLTDEAVIGLIAALTWFFWAQVMVCIVAEVVSVVRDVDIEVPGSFGIQRQMARSLIGAVVVAVVGLTAAGATTVDASAQNDSVSQEAQSSTSVDVEEAESDDDPVTETEAEDGPTVTLQQGESLMGLAETHLGDADRWEEIGDLNEGAEMVDGRTFRAADRLRAGWVLKLPADATSVETPAEQTVTEPQPRVVTVTEDDHRGLWGIAEEEYDDGPEYQQIWEANKGKTMPSGRVFDNPDLIHPGDRLDIPPATVDEPRAAPEAEQQPTPEDDTEGGPVPQVDALDQGADDPIPEASEITIATIADSEDDALPGWVLPGLTGAGGMLAGAALMVLKNRRNTHHRSRNPGFVMSSATTTIETEPSLFAAGRPADVTTAYLDEALRRLAGAIAETGAHVPAITAVRITDNELILHLRARATPPAGTGWESGRSRRIWSIDRAASSDDHGPETDDTLTPWLSLVTIGRDSGGGTWLLNLEGVVATLSGDHDTIEAFVRSVSTELACNPWTRLASVDLVGVPDSATRIAPARVQVHAAPATPATGSANELQATLDRLNHYDVDLATARTRGDDPDVWPTRVLITDGSAVASPEVTKLCRLIGSHTTRAAASVLVAGGDPISGGLEIHLESDGHLTCDELGLTLKACGLSVDEAEGVTSLLAGVDDETQTPPGNLNGAEPWKNFATSTGSLRSEHRLERRHEGTNVPDVASVLNGSDADYLDVAATTEADLSNLAPDVSSTVRDEVTAADPALDADVDAWFSGDDPRPRLRLLGPVEARTSGQALAKRKPFYTEMLTYLAGRENGATADEMADAFGISTSRLRTDINTLRDWLGRDPQTNESPYLPNALEGPSGRRRGVGVYEVLDVLVDFDLFRRLRLRGEARGDDGIADLRTALRLVNGRPFSQLRTGGWGWMLKRGDRLDHIADCAVADVSHIVVSHDLATGDLKSAHTAAQAALRALPEAEAARLDLAAVLSAEGHREQAERIVLDDVCNRSDDGEAPVELSERSEAVIRARGWLTR
ncbi:hypothetical protein [Aeromicrobium sp. CTD01-1L150]|uniref:hypothetical protein n=1 Tax=Aeromicrobium sp. CTD01-1L150 TaxID=3341830 RepID=UPI0035C1A597